MTRFVTAIVTVAIGAALFAVGVRESLAFVYRHAYGAGNVLDGIAGLPRWLIVVVPTLAGLLSGLVMHVLAPRSQNVSNVMEAVALGRVHLSLRATATRAAAAWTAIAGGLSIGREGPLIEFGGSLGYAMSRALRVTHEQARVLVAAGTAAGFAAAYNTPFAAVLFVLEAMSGIAAPLMLLTSMSAVVIASAVSRALVGVGPIYGERAFTLGTPWSLLLFVLLGAGAAVMAALFRKALGIAETLADRYPVPRPWRSAIGGLIVGLIASRLPHVVGNGFEALNLVIDSKLAVSVLMMLLVGKVLATSASVGSGVPGGVFTPVLLIGGVLGSLSGGAAAHHGVIGPADVGGFVLVGMAAMTAATTHASLTAAVMVFELSGDYPIVLPLLIATATATAASRLLGGRSVYFDELRRRGVAWELTLDERKMTT